MANGLGDVDSRSTRDRYGGHGPQCGFKRSLIGNLSVQIGHGLRCTGRRLARAPFSLRAGNRAVAQRRDDDSES